MGEDHLRSPVMSGATRNRIEPLLFGKWSFAVETPQEEAQVDSYLRQSPEESENVTSRLFTGFSARTRIPTRRAPTLLMSRSNGSFPLPEVAAGMIFDVTSVFSKHAE